DEGEMACGTVGPGRLSDPDRIVAAALEILRASGNEIVQDLAGEHLLITVGATREAIDPVRFLSNNSSGRMGYAIAAAAKRRGAQVTVIAGATTAAPPVDIDLIRAYSADEMSSAVAARIETASIFIGAAAVADYRPVERSARKLKKNKASLSLELERTPDILRQVAQARHAGLLVIGFAAETDNVLDNAREKLRDKDLDAIVANDVTQAGVGFDTATNEVTIISRDRKAPIHVPLMNKTDVATIILDEVVRIRAREKSSQQTQMRKPRKA
ncbi:MAG TPA: bifunctional phosphopantothenoylcysteine decarboxylase/phosphopantothenate--cysteine ligase CoaBC, partial [Pyrinomonadaceae bacterium]|nr:bifunctional phosphopantothenoylcysteine decarboxylase/phosphopantothenate--cysteine ligase CoaBC [Pyrinomonadaceae bacterium]